jgi:Tfp pilus assembly protein PilZ
MGDASFEGTSKNIGTGGMFVATERRYEVGDRCAISFSLPGWSPRIVVGAEVRWVHETPASQLGFGLEFLNLSIAADAAIDDFLRRVGGGPRPA